MFYFRADGNSKIGMGHLMRSMSIADSMRKLTKVSFLCADNRSAEAAKERGFETICLNTVPFSIDEAKLICEIVKDETTPFLLTDSYLVSNEYLSVLKTKFRVSCMDDIPKITYNSDVIVNYNCYADQGSYERLYCAERKTVPVILAGSNYIPVRKAFFDKSIEIRETVSNILISVGGSDELNLCVLILKELIDNPDTFGINFHVISGRFNSNYDKLVAFAKERKDITVYSNVEDMASLMNKMDMAVSAGGSTCYELCAQGIPFICFSYAENQMLLAEEMGKTGAAAFAGHITDEKTLNVVIESISDSVSMMLGNMKLRIKMHDNGRKSVNVDGADNLARDLLKTMEGLL